MAPPPSQDTLTRRISLLKTVPLFADLSEEELGKLVHDWRYRSCEKGEIIFHQGDESGELYILLQGRVRIFTTSPSGDETTINIFGATDLIGEFSTIDNLPRSASAQTLLPTAMLSMTRSRFLHHLRTMPNLALGLIQLLAHKVRWTTIYAETIAQYDAAGRLLHLLLLYNEEFGEEEEAGRRYLLDLGLNQTDLASLVGARRGWINRILGDWRKRGLIEYDEGRIIILDLPRVKAERDGRIEANVDEAKKW